MIPDKQVKKKFKTVASENPDKFYATNVLRAEGFLRKQCKCGTFFWTNVNDRLECGDPNCSGGFNFFEENPASKPLDYVEVWKKFSEHMTERGYTPINRYSVVARWRDDTDFVQASIYDFQPYVVNGEIEPPANPLVVPQFCLRFNDIDNVGVTMSHNTGFVMIGQHAFVDSSEWNQDKYFKDLLDWFVVILGIPKEELILHEDAWAGGGNFGPCMEVFSRGVELGNQVYMLYEQTEDGDKELSLKVLDMGMGHERVTWFTQGKGTMYDATFPTVVKELIKQTKIDYDNDFIQKYLPYGSYLNLDEVDDVNESWKYVAEKTGYSVKDLKEKLIPLSALYSVAEHSRSLLVAISDGALPSNVKGGYNLRVILRRALEIIQRQEWNVNLFDICKMHAEYLKPLFPELNENLDHVKKILEVETKKFEESKARSVGLVKKAIKSEVTTEKMLELYDSHGISPETIQKEAKLLGKIIEVPENFYSLVSERHNQSEQKTQTKKADKIEIDTKLDATKAMYYDNYDLIDFDATVVQVIPHEDNSYAILDRTAFYPTSGGQVHDIGTINDFEVSDVLKQGNNIIHLVKTNTLKVGDKVKGHINFDRRLQLAQHHTATHILTGSARRILGDHIWQAGAAKTLEKSRLDITHYDQLTEKELKDIEELANSIVKKNLPVFKSFMKRNIAEAKYGVRLYQGGAVPGKELRIVNIENFDVEACGGTHLNVTGDVGSIKIMKTSKIQDGVLRLEFVAGNAAEKHFEEERNVLKHASILLDCTKKQIPARAQELFSNWKKARKGKLEDAKLKSEEEFEGDVISKTAEVLKTQPQHIVKTLERFKADIEKALKK